MSSSLIHRSKKHRLDSAGHILCSTPASALKFELLTKFAYQRAQNSMHISLQSSLVN